MIHQLVNNPSLGWNHSNTIYLAFDIVTDFGEVLEKNSWMVYGVPESLLTASKENVRLAFEVLFRFLHNKNVWEDFRQKYPKVARTIISNSFYKAMINAIPFIERFIPDDKAIVCVEVAKFMQNSKSEKLIDFFKRENQSEIFFQTLNEIEEKTKKLYEYLDSQKLFIKDDIFN